jgi:long-subunit fatty acid transport protein
MLQYDLPVVSGYDADLTFDGRSVYWGFQLNGTYEISEMLSVALGVRYVPAKNVYQGSITNVTVNTTEGEVIGQEYIETITPLLDQTIGVLNVATSALGAGIDAGLVDPNAEVTNPEIQQIMTLLGNPDATNQEAFETMGQTQETLEGVKNADVSDMAVDVEQTGSFFTPIIGVNISPNEYLNIALKYEHKTYLTVENNTTQDDLGLFPDGSISRADIPGIISAGIGYTDDYWFEAQLSYNYYLDKYVDWGGNVRDISVWKGVDHDQIRMREIDKNSFDIALGLQFNISEVFSISAGAMYQKAGVSDAYNSDFDFATPSYVALGGGIMWKITNQLTLDAGVSNIFYKDANVEYFDPVLNNHYAESYGKEAYSFAVGLSYSIPY